MKIKPNMDWSTFISQWKALMRRNLLMKRRNYYQLITAFIFPIIVIWFILDQSNKSYIKTTGKIGVEYDLPLVYQDQDLIGKSGNFHLCVAPRDIQDDFLNSIQTSLSSYGQKRFVQITKFEDEKHLNEGLLKRYEYNVSDCDAGVIIKGNVSTSGSYIVRVPEDGCSPVLAQYCSYGMLSNIQQAVDNAYIQEWTGDSNFKLPISKVRGLIDVNEKNRSMMYQITKYLLVLSFLPIITIISENLIQERNLKIKESMLLMGMKPLSYWLAWLFGELMLIIAIMFPISITLFIANVFPITDILLHFVLWIGMGGSVVVFTMGMTRFCTRPLVANCLAFFFMLAAIFSDMIHSVKTFKHLGPFNYILMLLSPVAYERGFDKVIREHDYVGALPAILLIFADFIIYSIIDIIMENAFPHGITDLCILKHHKKKNVKVEKSEDVRENEAFIDPLFSSPNLEPCIKLKNIKKTYSSIHKPKTTVLDGVSFSIYKGEVTCLLGPNGAGKSTLMKIISRVLRPDEGKVAINTSLNLGVCPQENILQDDLNTYEHLQFFGGLKGIPYEKLDSTVTTLLESFDLMSKKDSKSKVLSGGQKRKLCVAIAMIGEPEILLLDEPSSGMNPHSRRLLWNILQEYTKSGRSILFTTHYMDEAELLSDRIAFLNYGKLKYYGTSMNIKKQFGGGYNIRITLQSEPSIYCRSELMTLIRDLPCNPKMILKSDSELIVKLPSFDAAHSVELFSKLEEQYKDIGTDCFSISVPALEEIFSVLAEGKEEKAEQTTEEKTNPLKFLSEKKMPSEEYREYRPKETEIPKFSYTKKDWTILNELLRVRIRLLLRTLQMFFPILFPVTVLTYNYLLFDSMKPTTAWYPRLHEDHVLQVINATGMPLTDLENSLSKLDMKFELVNSAFICGKKNFVRTAINKYAFTNGMLDMNWNWTVSLTNPYALPALQNLMSNIMWNVWEDKLGRKLEIQMQPVTGMEKGFMFFRSETLMNLMHISFCMVFIALFFGVEVVKEKEKRIIWLISRTRNNGLMYWLSTFLTHLAVFSMAFCMMQNLLLIFGVYIFQKFSLWIGFYLSMPGCLLTAYLLGHCFKTYKSADIGLTFTTVFATGFLFFASIMAIARDVPYIDILSILTMFLIPIYAPFGLVILLSLNEDDSFTEGTQWSIVCYLIIPLSFVFYAVLTLYLGKWKLFQRKEKIKMMNQEAWDQEHNPKATVVLKSVRKAYTSSPCSFKKKETVALKDLSLSFLKGEIFALMGSNGAGKSTLMKLLSLNVGSFSGEIFIRDKYMESTTYCAEENTIWPNVTVEEHVILFGVLNGIPIEHMKQITEKFMKDFGLETHAKKKANHLSGGFKRKLSIALSLIGNSNLVLLDEPTTGMDPVSKQHLWKKLHQEFPENSERTLILTTHSSNEAEVNCSRIGLFMNGNLRCLGTSDALKKEFRKFFDMTIKLKSGEKENFHNFLMSEIPEAFEKSKGGITLHYYIPREAFKCMSELFKKVEKIQKFEGVEDCVINECSLDQIILDILSGATTKVAGDDVCAV